ncbi:MAG TPA: hypothetical protein VGJ77_16200 [Gaiellaceae bacterium]|jgi:hypothetical protein
MSRLRTFFIAGAAALVLAAPAAAGSAPPPQAGSSQVSLVSNIMKTKHDTAKNSISNVR